MRRREFITLLGGAATAWPLPARAQQRAMPVIGLLSGRAPETDAPLLAPFRQGLREIGYVVDQNVSLEYRWASGEYDRLSALATELVDRNVTVIVAIGGVLSAIAARSRTATIPIVFVAGDPVKRGLVTSLSRPGGNITGVSTLLGDVVSKQLGLTYELLPTARKIAVVVNPTNPEADDVPSEVQRAALALGKQVEVLNVRSANELETTFERIRSINADGLLVAVDALFFAQADRFVALAARHRVPTVYFRREFSDAGGLMSYGSNPGEAYRQVGVYTGRILNGEKPADLPIVQSAKFELVINLKTARALGLEIPPMLLARADEVIE